MSAAVPSARGGAGYDLVAQAAPGILGVTITGVNVRGGDGGPGVTGGNGGAGITFGADAVDNISVMLTGSLKGGDGGQGLLGNPGSGAFPAFAHDRLPAHQRDRGRGVECGGRQRRGWEMKALAATAGWAMMFSARR